MPKLASDKHCTGCMACYDACKYKAIGVIEKNCQPYVEVDKNACVNCGLCTLACPVVTSIQKNSVKNMKVTNAQKGAFINKVTGITLENIEIETADDAYLQVENATDIVIDGKAYDKISERRLLTQN